MLLFCLGEWERGSESVGVVGVDSDVWLRIITVQSFVLPSIIAVTKLLQHGYDAF